MQILTSVFNWLHAVSYFFFLYQSPSSSLSSSHIYEVLSFSPSVSITHCKYQVKPHSSPRFSAASAIVHRNHFFHLYQHNKSSESMKFRQASNSCKRVLEVAILAYAKKTRVHHFPETWLSRHLANC